MHAWPSKPLACCTLRFCWIFSWSWRHGFSWCYQPESWAWQLCTDSRSVMWTLFLHRYSRGNLVTFPAALTVVVQAWKIPVIRRTVTRNLHTFTPTIKRRERCSWRLPDPSFPTFFSPTDFFQLLITIECRVTWSESSSGGLLLICFH